MSKEPKKRANKKPVSTAPEDRVSPAQFVYRNRSKPIRDTMKVAGKSKTAWSLSGAGGLTWISTATDWLDQGLDGVFWVLGILPAVASQVGTEFGTISQMAGWLKLNVQPVSATVALLLIGVAIARHVRDKRDLERLRGQP